jgi:hypothetical protein
LGGLLQKGQGLVHFFIVRLNIRTRQTQPCRPPETRQPHHHFMLVLKDAVFGLDF